jgi:hypothetical protein
VNQIFISFKGTDFNGNYLTSNTQAIANFVDTFPEDMYANMRTWAWTKGYQSRQERNSAATANIEAVK